MLPVGHGRHRLLDGLALLPLQSVYCRQAVGNGGVFLGGSIPTGSSPCPSNPQLAAGPCGPPPTIAVTSTLCCQHAGSCSQITTKDPGDYSVWRWSCQYQANPNFTVGSGTCDGPSGLCNFGH